MTENTFSPKINQKTLDSINPRFPIYVISKGRWESRLTSKTLERMNVPYRIVIEPQEYDNYAAVIDPRKILVLPFSNLGQGGIPARNWVWDHATEEGHLRHWILDDNIRDFYRLNRNAKIRLDDGLAIRLCEDFTDRFSNVPMSGINYEYLCASKDRYTPYYYNTRVYSCILLSNEVDYRWRGRYNEDTDLSLRFLKDGHCTILFKFVLCGKVATMTMKGGNTEEVYAQGKEDEFDNRYTFAKSLYDQHPDVVKITKKWRRWHHQVDYSKFTHRPILKEGLNYEDKVNEHGLVLVRKKV